MFGDGCREKRVSQRIATGENRLPLTAWDTDATASNNLQTYFSVAIEVSRMGLREDIWAGNLFVVNYCKRNSLMLFLGWEGTIIKCSGSVPLGARDRRLFRPQDEKSCVNIWLLVAFRTASFSNWLCFSLPDSIPSWNWPNLCLAWRHWSWQPKKQWRVTANITATAFIPFFCLFVHLYFTNLYNIWNCYTSGGRDFLGGGGKCLRKGRNSHPEDTQNKVWCL